MRTTIRLKDELLKRAKNKAARDGRTLTSLIEEGLLAVINGGDKAKSRKIKALPVPKRKGGLKPGVDVNRNASLLDLADKDGEWTSRT